MPSCDRVSTRYARNVASEGYRDVVADGEARQDPRTGVAQQGYFINAYRNLTTVISLPSRDCETAFANTRGR
jgi:hypothetical protein